MVLVVVAPVSGTVKGPGCAAIVDALSSSLRVANWSDSRTDLNCDTTTGVTDVNAFSNLGSLRTLEMAVETTCAFKTVSIVLETDF